MNRMNDIPKICFSSQDRMELERECFRGLMESFESQSHAHYEHLLCSSQPSSSLSSKGKRSTSLLKILMGLSALSSIPFASASRSDGSFSRQINVDNSDFPQNKEVRPLTISFDHGNEPVRWLEVRNARRTCSAFLVENGMAISVGGCFYSDGYKFPGRLYVSPLRGDGSRESRKPADIVRNEKMEKGGCSVLPGSGGRHSCDIEFIKFDRDSNEVLSEYRKTFPTKELCHRMNNILEGIPMWKPFQDREQMPDFSIWRSIDTVGSNFRVDRHGKRVGGNFELKELSVFKDKNNRACSGSGFCIDVSDDKDKLYLCDNSRVRYHGYAGEPVFFEDHLVGLVRRGCSGKNLPVVNLCSQGHLFFDQDDEIGLHEESMVTIAQETTTEAQAKTSFQATTEAQVTKNEVQTTTTEAQETTTAAQEKTTVDPKIVSDEESYYASYIRTIGWSFGGFYLSVAAILTACCLSYFKKRRAEGRLAQQNNIELNDML